MFKKGKHNLTFYELLNTSESSVYKKLRNCGLSFSYFIYKIGSMFIHGSTIEHLFYNTSDNLWPAFIGLDSDKEETPNNFIVGTCQDILLMLCILKRKIWA